MTPEEELAKIREQHKAHVCYNHETPGICVHDRDDWPCPTIRALTLAAQLAREHAQSGCGGGCGDIIARKIEGGSRGR